MSVLIFIKVKNVYPENRIMFVESEKSGKK